MRVTKVRRAMKPKMIKGRPKRRIIPSGTDPYLPWSGSREVLVCRRCHSFYFHKRWYLESDVPSPEIKKSVTGMIVCPACRKIEDHFPGGIIILQGDFLKQHKEEILHRIHNEEGRAKNVNPLERVISIKDYGDRVEIHTTGERFAQRIGRELQRAYKGHASYHWSGDDKFVRVSWERSED